MNSCNTLSSQTTSDIEDANGAPTSLFGVGLRFASWFLSYLVGTITIDFDSNVSLSFFCICAHNRHATLTLFDSAHYSFILDVLFQGCICYFHTSG